MIRTQAVLLRIAEAFFRDHLLGLYRWDRVGIEAPERRPEIPPGLNPRDRRVEMERREGKGKFLEKERISFGPWEILIYSAQEKGPLGEVTLRNHETAQEMLTGPLDASTWDRIGEHIRLSHQRKAS
jgi:hypothetical protein